MANDDRRNHMDNPTANSPIRMYNLGYNHIRGKASNPGKNSQVTTRGNKQHPNNHRNSIRRMDHPRRNKHHLPTPFPDSNNLRNL